MKKILFAVCVVVLSLSFINISCAQREGISVGDKAPDFTLEDTGGNAVSLKDTVAASNSTLVVFWATWCPYCVKEIPELKKLDKEYKDKGLKILAVDIGESKAKVDSYAKGQGIEYTVLLDQNNKVANQYGIMGIPANILIGKDGTIKYKGTQPPPAEELPR